MNASPLSQGVQLAIDAAGNASELARRLGVKVQSIQQWKRVPDDRVLDVERVTGVPREKLRPDLAAIFAVAQLVAQQMVRSA
jgi:DNA-binding transcriptional regulator YdaS (Cro superfamily)